MAGLRRIRPWLALMPIGLLVAFLGFKGLVNGQFVLGDFVRPGYADVPGSSLFVIDGTPGKLVSILAILAGLGTVFVVGHLNMSQETRSETPVKRRRSSKKKKNHQKANKL